jgi:hypothetical protein
MSWDGKKVGGIVNPGPNSVPLGDVSIDFSSWTVRIQAAGKDGPIAASFQDFTLVRVCIGRGQGRPI